MRELYVQYTDQVEPYGLDECWLDVGGSAGLFGSGATIADEIRLRIRRDLGLTVSVGVSFNKVFAKLGSDYKKPDATTVITRGNYRDLVWTLPVSDLLYVGPATTKKLARFGVRTVGDLANSFCAAFQLTANGRWRAADLSGDGSVRVTLPFKMLNSASLFPLKVLSLLAFWHDCDIILAVHSDCPPLANGCVRTPFYHARKITMDFLFKCPTSLCNQPLLNVN